MKSIVQRINFYTRKVKERGAVSLFAKSPRAHMYRYSRLRAYKMALNKLIELERGLSQVISKCQRCQITDGDRQHIVSEYFINGVNKEMCQVCFNSLYGKKWRAKDG